MYLKSSKFSMNRRTRRSNPFRVILLLVLVGAAIYANEVIVPSTGPLFVPTSTPTRSPESFVTDAQALEGEGKYTQAIKAYNQAVIVDPRNINTYISLARLQVYTGDYPNAVTNTENALLLNPNSAVANALRGWALGFQGDYVQGEAACRKAIGLDANNPAAYAYLAEVLVQMNDSGLGEVGTLDKAIDASRTAERLAPNSLEGHRARAVVLEATQNNEEAVNEFAAAVAINKFIPDLHLSLGRNLRALGQDAKAIDEFNQAIPLAPADPLPKTYISRTYAKLGQWAKAIQYAQQALKDSPTDPYLWANLGVMYYHNAALADAIPNLRMAVQGGTTTDGKEVKGLPLDYGAIAEYYYTYGLALAKQGDCTEAIRIAQMMQQTVANDEISVYNAQEMINICQQQLSTGVTTATPTITPTPLPGARPTSGPTSPTGTP
jgi:tetratricopeptide (TPR) repeat protein